MLILRLKLRTRYAEPVIRKALRRVLERFRPREKLTCSEWADKKRILKTPAAYPGKWKTSRTPYLKEPMDALHQPGVKEVWLKFAAQTGKSEVLNNWIGVTIDQDPSAMMLVEPTIWDAKSYSKKRIHPLLSGSLPHIFGDMKSRTTGQEILDIDFPGGFLALRGANSESGLSSTPSRYVFGDELKNWPRSAGKGGDPLDLLFARTRSYEKRGAKKGLVSSPGIGGLCRMDQGYETGDQRKLFVPCPVCKKEQILVWRQIKWQKAPLKAGGYRHLPKTAYYECEHCKAKWDNETKDRAVRKARWEATNPDALPGVVSFHLPGWYSVFVTLASIVTDYLKAVREAEKGNTEPLKVWTNTTAAETWIEKGETVDQHELMKRREVYPADPVPAGVAVISAGVDVQKDRLKVAIVGWGRDEESWLLTYKILIGDPRKREVWQELFDLLRLPFNHPSGAQLYISSAFIDSGYATKSVYQFVRPFQSYGFFCSKGMAGEARPPLNNPKTPNQQGCLLWIIGVDHFKALVYRRLTFDEPGPGYIHFPTRAPEAFFKGLTIEEQRTKYSRGQYVKYWHKPKGAINDPLDCMVYATGAFLRLGVTDELNRYVDELQGKAVSLDQNDDHDQGLISSGVNIYG